jgi:hypothetical protein
MVMSGIYVAKHPANISFQYSQNTWITPPTPPPLIEINKTAPNNLKARGSRLGEVGGKLELGGRHRKISSTLDCNYRHI